MKTWPQEKPVLTAGLLILCFVTLSAFGVVSLVRHESKRDLKDWQIFLEATTNTKARTVNNWLADQLAVVSMLSQNASLQHYTRESSRPGIATEIKQAQLTFLRSLINTTADRNGFLEHKPSIKIKADIQKKAANGLAVISSDFEFIIGTPGFDFDPKQIKNSNSDLRLLTRPIITAVNKGEDGFPAIGFIAPIISQKTKQANSGKVIGAIYGYKSLAPLLTQLTAASTKNSSEETLLIFKEQNSICNITPLSDGTPSLEMKRPLTTPSASAYALNSPGTFNQRLDYQGNDVFLVSTAIDNTPWVLVHKIDTSQALTESRNHQRFLVTTLGLITILIATLLAASWWYVNSIKKQALAKDLRKQNNLLAVKTHLLDSINDNIHDLLLLVNSQRQCIFISKRFARKLSYNPQEVAGRSLHAVMGKDQATTLDEHITLAFSKKQTVIAPLAITISSTELFVHSTFTPLHFEKAVGEYDAALITFHDLTALKTAEDRQNTLHQQLIKTLMSAIDRHDPYSANHSAQTANIALLVGKTMNMASSELKTLTTAASLCNLGKLSIDANILTKTDKLNDDELREIRLESQHAYDLLKEIDFDGPVKETIIQKYEHLDGSGHPYGLKSEVIIPTARILAVVNSFVAMISPRAYRNKISPQAALEQLMDDVDSTYDRKVLAALFQVIENEIDWQSGFDASAR